MKHNERNGLIFLYTLLFFLLTGITFAHQFKPSSFLPSTFLEIIEPNPTGSSHILMRGTNFAWDMDRDNASFNYIGGDPVGATFIVGAADNDMIHRTSGFKYLVSVDGGVSSSFTIDLDPLNPILLEVEGTTKRVTVDAANSCGAGFKCLRVPN